MIHYECYSLVFNVVERTLKEIGHSDFIEEFTDYVEYYFRDNQLSLEEQFGSSIPDYYKIFYERNMFYSTHEALVTPEGDGGILYSSSKKISIIISDSPINYMYIYPDLMKYATLIKQVVKESIAT